MNTDQHEHKHSPSMKPRVHRHALTEVDAAIAAMEARVAALEETMANVILTISQLPGPITPPIDPGDPPVDPVTPPVDPPIVPVTAPPFAAPVTAGTVTVPSSIDHTGATDVRAALQAFIDGTPNGRVIEFQPNAKYRIGSALTLSARSNLILDGKGSELWVYPGGYAQTDSTFRLLGATDISLKNFTMTGSSPTPGTAIFGQERQTGVQIIYGGAAARRIEVTGCLIRNMYGDGVETIYDVYGVWVHHNEFRNNGRSHITMQCGDGYFVEDNDFYLANNSVAVFDVEPFEDNDSWCRNFTFQRNNIYGLDGFPSNFYFAANNTGGGPNPGPIENITVKDNVCHHGSMRAIIGAAGPRPKRVTITGNVALGEPQTWNPDWTAGPPKNTTGGLGIYHCDGVTITGNACTFDPPHTLANIVDSTAVVYVP